MGDEQDQIKPRLPFDATKGNFLPSALARVCCSIRTGPVRAVCTDKRLVSDALAPRKRASVAVPGRSPFAISLVSQFLARRASVGGKVHYMITHFEQQPASCSPLSMSMGLGGPLAPELPPPPEPYMGPEPRLYLRISRTMS
jgi:hypothetical protein